VTLRVTSGTVRVFGVSFGKSTPGVIYDSLGLNGAYVRVLAAMFNAEHWGEQLRHYDPDLVIINYGTNESVYPKFVDFGYEKDMREIVRRIRAALPEAPILVMSPMDRGERDASGQISTVQVMPRLVKLEQQVAEATQSAFFNTFEAMGGSGTMGRWYAAEPRLVGADFIHPMPAGAKIVGGLLYEGLLDGYNQFKLKQMKLKLAAAGAAETRGPQPSGAENKAR
jgi:lysophospholipase L1-like esterase